MWLAGIGGAGMSAYARLAQAWGAEVAGWDRVSTPYLDFACQAVPTRVRATRRQAKFPFGGENPFRTCLDLHKNVT